ncbi:MULTISPECIES: DUF397 domain-containing protein [unclassified Streptomyces]|uniref:DUF397 domain-containing protein n=1 Tax=unclassified Streptomyces TaxID=2593676 RepID=UPI00081D8907|nr:MULTISPECIES: DUF397 domain-containing protein [unclassified Streptomyces]MYZ38853.1 DUF397 domain-containing protein [Streptomyces sp. SID4917]SCG00746.1 protein of unknown function [Streptomyces sp. MnatMP-M17]
MTVSRIPKASALTGWRKSSYSGPDNGSCVEVADGVPGIVPVRDSKNPDGPALTVPAPAWSSFITALTKDALNA